MPTVLEAFGQRLRSIRIRKGFSQERLSEMAGFDRTYVSLLERGKRSPSLDAISRLAGALEVDPKDLVEGVPATNPRTGASSTPS